VFGERGVLRVEEDESGFLYEYKWWDFVIIMNLQVL
jgi:hypothetical protein